MGHISDAFEDLSHALRVLLEAHAKAHRFGLLQTDRAEAVGNIETALASVLNAFHSLYDSMEKEGQKNLINWYDAPELATILVLRNARHHNQAKKIRTLYTFHAQEAEDIAQMRMYVLVNFPAQEEGASTFEVYISWSDLKALLDMPRQESRVSEASAQSIREYLASDLFSAYAEHYELTEDRIFFNVVPLFVNAAAKIVPLIHCHVSPRSMESELYLSLFQDMLPALTKRHEVNCGPIALMP